MAEIKKKVKIDWSETLLAMEVGESVESKFIEKDYASQRANYLKSLGRGSWSIKSNYKEEKITVTRIS